MNYKKIWYIIILIAIIVFISKIVIYYNNTVSTDIAKLIEFNFSQKYEENINNIKIVDTYDIYDKKIVGFTYDDNKKCSIAFLKRNGDSKYEMIRVKRYEILATRNLDIFYDYIYIYDENEEYARYLVVFSMNPELSKIKLTINGWETTYKEIISNPSITVLKIPEYNFTGEYLFYDKSGNLIE